MKNWNHQTLAIELARRLYRARQGALALNMGMGSGKTRVSIKVSEERQLKRILVVCPKKAMDVWPYQFGQHSDRDFEVFKCEKGTGERQTGDANERLQLFANRPIAIVNNYEAFWREPFRSLVLRTKWDGVIYDESHHLKMPGGKASMFAALLARRDRKSFASRIPHRMMLSGTFLAHSPLDIYAQYRALDPRIFGSSYAVFKARYAIMENIDFKNGAGAKPVVTGYQNQQDMVEKMAQIMFECGDEVLDLPEQYHEQRYYTLNPKAMRFYRDLEKWYVAQINDGEVTAANGLVKLLRLQQATSGHATTDAGQFIETLDTSKRELLAEVLEEIDPKEKVVIFARFKPDLKIIRQVLEDQNKQLEAEQREGAPVRPLRIGEISGSVNDYAKWFAGDIDRLIVQVQSGSEALDFTHARYGIYYSLSFSLSQFRQSLKRIHRPGQTRPCYYIHLVARHTVDERIYKSLQEHEEVVNAVINHLRAYQRAA